MVYLLCTCKPWGFWAICQVPDLPEALLLAPGKFMHLVEFMCGVTAVITPQTAQQLTGANLSVLGIFAMSTRAVGQQLSTRPQ